MSILYSIKLHNNYWSDSHFSGIPIALSKASLHLSASDFSNPFFIDSTAISLANISVIYTLRVTKLEKIGRFYIRRPSGLVLFLLNLPSFDYMLFG